VIGECGIGEFGIGVRFTCIPFQPDVFGSAMRGDSAMTEGKVT
jgi:hypothetical protein